MVEYDLALRRTKADENTTRLGYMQLLEECKNTLINYW
jgi:hypothetical protein